MFRWNIFMGVVFCLAVVDVLQQSWICDDAFLSFRYAEHFSTGRGLVFNEGEYVEGYSNFLWTILLAMGMLIGLSPEVVSILLGVLFFAGTFFMCTRIGNGMVTTCALAGMLHIRIFATAGLESSMFWLLLVSLVWCLQEKRAALGR